MCALVCGFQHAWAMLRHATRPLRVRNALEPPEKVGMAYAAAASSPRRTYTHTQHTDTQSSQAAAGDRGRESGGELQARAEGRADAVSGIGRRAATAPSPIGRGARGPWTCIGSAARASHLRSCEWGLGYKSPGDTHLQLRDRLAAVRDTQLSSAHATILHSIYILAQPTQTRHFENFSRVTFSNYYCYYYYYYYYRILMEVNFV